MKLPVEQWAVKYDDDGSFQVTANVVGTKHLRLYEHVEEAEGQAHQETAAFRRPAKAVRVQITEVK